MPTAIRLAAGAVLGAGLWPLLGATLPRLPAPACFVLAWMLFTLGPGLVVAGRLTRDLDPIVRLIVSLGAGSAATAAVIDLLGRAHLVPSHVVDDDKYDVRRAQWRRNSRRLRGRAARGRQRDRQNQPPKMRGHAAFPALHPART